MRTPNVRSRYALALILAGCAADSPPAVTVERVDSAGIELVANRGPAVRLAWRFTQLFTLGGESEGPESFYSLTRTRVGADGAGSLYVLDGDNHRVAVFDSAGALVRTLGREGGGPGELEWPFNMSVASDGTVSVYDAGKRSLVRFSPDGVILDELRPEIAYFGPTLIAKGTTVVYNSVEYRRDAPTSFQLLMSWRDGEIAELARIEYPTPQMTTFPSCGATFPAEQVFAPHLVWDAVGGTVVLAGGAGYRLDVHRDGRHVRSIRRGVEPRATTETLALQQLGDGSRINECRIPPDEYLRGAGFAPVFPTVDAVAVAPDGEIWVRRGHVRGEPAPVDVFGADGTYLGTPPAGTPFPAVFLPDSKIAAIETDSLDVDRLVIYRIVRGVAG